MENKRYRQDSKAYEQAYMKWLQKIVYQKEKELATLNESIQLEELRAYYEKTISSLEETVAEQRRQLQQKSLGNRPTEEVELQHQSTTARQTILTKLENRNRSSKRKLEIGIECVELESAPDLQLLRQLKQNKQQYEATKDSLTRLEQHMQQLKEDLLAEQMKNDFLSAQVDRLTAINSELGASRDQALRQLEEAHAAQTTYLDRIGTLKADKEKLCGQLVQEIEKQRLLERSKGEAMQELRDEMQRLKVQFADISKSLELERQLRNQAQLQLSCKIESYQNELSSQQKNNLRQRSELESQLSSISAKFAQERFALQSQCARMERDKHQLKQDLQIFSLRFSVLENKYIVLQTQKTLKLMQEMEEVKPVRLLTEKSLKDQTLLLDSSTTFLKHHDNDELNLVRGELQKAKVEHQVDSNRMSSEVAAIRQDCRLLAIRFEEQKRQNQSLQEKKERAESELDQLLLTYRECRDELVTAKEQLASLKDSITKKELETDKLRCSLQDNRKTTISIITQKDELTKQIEALKKQLKGCIGDVEAMKMLYANSEWWQSLVMADAMLQARVRRALTQWQVKYIICESVCRSIAGVLADNATLEKFVSNIQKGAISEMPLLDDLLRLVSTLNSHTEYQARPAQHFSSQQELSVAPFTIELSHIFTNQTKLAMNQQEQLNSEQQLNNEQELLNNLEKEIEDHPSALEQTIVTDASEIKENYKMVKAVNEQLFMEVQSKENQLKAMAAKVRSLEQFGLKQEHLRSTVRTLLREVKPNDKLFTLVSSLCSLLQLK